MESSSKKKILKTPILYANYVTLNALKKVNGIDTLLPKSTIIVSMEIKWKIWKQKKTPNIFVIVVKYI